MTYNLDPIVLLLSKQELQHLEDKYPLQRSYLKEQYILLSKTPKQIAEAHSSITESDVEEMISEYHIYKSTQKYLSECDPNRAKRILHELVKQNTDE